MRKNKKYVTLEDGVDFRTIAKVMTENGYKMNHATARNLLINAIKKILNFTANKIDTKISDNVMDTMIKDPNVHIAVADLLFQEKKTEPYFNKEVSK